METSLKLALPKFLLLPNKSEYPKICPPSPARTPMVAEALVICL